MNIKSINLNPKQKHALSTAGIIMSLAWPTMVEQIMQTAVQYIDTAMVGALGTSATAAVGSTVTINWLIFSSISAMSIGFLAFISQACGAEDYTRAKEGTAQSVIVTLITGIAFTVITLSLSGKVPVWMQVDSSIQHLASVYFFVLYLPMLPRTAITIFGTVLRAAGDTKTPMKVGIIINVINVILNFLLIYDTRTVNLLSLEFVMPGAGWGVVGAAAASAVAYTVGSVLITRVLWKHSLISPRGIRLKPDYTILKPCMRIALPNMFQRFGTSLGYVAFAAMINSIGEVATAAQTIANTVESAFYIPGYGMQTAAATLAGNAYGADDNKKMNAVSRMFIPIEVILMMISGLALFLTAVPLVKLFSDNPEVIALGSTVLKMVAVSEPFFGVALIIEGMMMGVGKTKEPFIFNITGMWGIRIAGTFICIRFFGKGLVAAWACMIAHNLLLFLLFSYVFVRGTWNPLNDKKVRSLPLS